MDIQPAIEIAGLTKIFGVDDDEVTAVDGLDLNVGRGEIFGFLGPNGSGKTTTIKMLAGVIYPTSGSASLLGAPMGDPEIRARIGYAPELVRFHSRLRAEDFLDFNARLHGIPAARRRERVREVLSLTGLSENARSFIRAFSKGMLQRIVLAQAIIAEPDLLFLDEPTDALDPMGRRDLRELLLAMKDRGATIFLNSHQLSEVEMICSRVGIMKTGRLIKVDELQSLLKPVHEVDIAVSGLPLTSLAAIREIAVSVTREDGESIRVTLDSEDKVNVLADIIMRSGADLRQFTPRKKMLETAFLEEMGEGRE